MHKTILILLVVVCCGIPLHAQDTTFNRVVTVERDYQPDIEKAVKIKLQPVIQKEEVEPNPVVYSTYSNPLSVGYNLHPLQAAKTTFIPQPTLNGLIEGAIGHRNSHLLFAYRLTQKKKTSLNLYANHDAYWGRDALSTSALGMELTRHFSKADLYFNVAGDHEYFTYYGRLFDTNSNIATPLAFQHLWNVNTHIGLKSTNKKAVQYRLETGYTAYIASTDAIEHLLRSHLDIAWANDNHSAGIHTSVQNSLRNDSNTWNKHALRIEPFYAYKNERLHVHLGVNFDVNIGMGKLFSTLDNVAFAPSPNVTFDWTMIKNVFTLYAHAKGSIGTGSLDEYLGYNRYLNIAEGMTFDLPRAYTPVDAQVGFKIRPLRTMLIDVYGGYAYMHNACNMMAIVDPLYEHAALDFKLQLADYQRWKLGATLHWHIRDIVELNLGANYYLWQGANGMTTYDRPSWDAFARLDIHFDSKWSIYSENYLVGGCWAATTVGDKWLKPTVSLNLGGQYSVNNWLHVYLQLNNYLNRKNDIFYGYQSQGCHFLLGLKYKF